MSLSRRTLLRLAVVSPVLAGAMSRVAFAQEKKADPEGPFKLPPLAYPFRALEPHIDTMTMEIHHDKHHATYVKNLNDAVLKTPELAGKSAEDLIKMLDKVPESVRTAVRNNAGGHVNHSLFWTNMNEKAGGTPTGAIGDGIKAAFGSFDNFTTAFNDAGLKRFGSGWVWLVLNPEGKLAIMTTPNQDNPMMAEYKAYPILGNDLWEHAYYLKYQNKRIDYLKAWWNVVDWKAVNARLTKTA